MFKKFRFTVGRKIVGSFLLIIILYIINSVVIVNTSGNVEEMIAYSSQSVRPSSEKLNEFNSLVSRSKMLITNWVYLPSNVENKEELIQLHNIEYPKLREELIGLTQNWENDSLKSIMRQIITDYDKILTLQREEIMNALSTFDDYENPMIKFAVDDKLESEVIPSIDQLNEQLNFVNQEYVDIRNRFDKEISDSMNDLKSVTFILLFFNVLVAVASVYFLVRNLTIPINHVKRVIDKLGLGEISTEDDIEVSDDEVGDMAKSVKNLTNGLNSTSRFAEEIGRGNLEADFRALSKQDVLGNALLEMRNSLRKVAEEDEKRRWFNEGVAKFAELMRKNSEDIRKLSDELLRNIIKYMDANQGALYLVDESTQTDAEIMKLYSCYAWDKHKFIDQEIQKGDGLAGQAWQEGEEIFMTDVPDEYIDITSGLGHSNPTCVFIVPLKVNDDIFGIVEMASFDEIPEYKREFLLKLAESIASTISNVKTSARTKELLDESQLMTEQMKAQEEEMRQNMEEIQATQEEMERGQQESVNTLNAINKSVATFELDSEGNIENANENFINIVRYNSSEVFGETFRIFLKSEDESIDPFRQLWKQMQEGTDVAGEFLLGTKNGDIRAVKGTFIPTIGSDDALSKVNFFGISVAEYKEFSE